MRDFLLKYGFKCLANYHIHLHFDLEFYNYFCVLMHLPHK